MSTSDSIVVLKKINRLEQIKVQPTLYKQDKYDPESPGELEGQYKGNTLLGSKRNVTPSYDSLKGQWAFAGTLQDLKRIQDRLKLRDENNKLIEIQEDTLTNMFDPFWAHTSLYTKKIMEEGSTSLNLNDPLEELLYLVQKGSSFVKGAKENQSAYIIADSNLELIVPRREIEAEAKSVDKTIKAIKLLDAMGLEKMNTVAYLMDLPGYQYNDKDSERLKALLYSSAAMNTHPMYKVGAGITHQDRFIELAEVNNEELNIMKKVQQAKIQGAISANTRTGYTFKGERLDDGSIKNDRDLMRFYLNHKNHESLKELENYLLDTESILNNR